MCGLNCYIFKQKGASFGSKEWKIAKSSLATDHSLFSNSETLNCLLTRTENGCKEGPYKVARSTEDWLPGTITLCPDFTVSEVEAALSLWKQKKRKEELLTHLHIPPPPPLGGLYLPSTSQHKANLVCVLRLECV